MPFKMYGDVILTRDVTESGLRAGDVGTVVELHVVPGVPEEGYSVEFFDMTGNTVAVVTLPASALRLPTPSPQRVSRVGLIKPRSGASQRPAATAPAGSNSRKCGSPSPSR